MPAITSGQLLQLVNDEPVEFLVTDSRKAVIHQHAVFFSIAGEHHDGHAYMDSLYAAGIRQFVVEREVPAYQFPEANILQVTSAIHALQQLAAFNRQQYSVPVIGITGSNGKTIIKEWLYQLLAREYKIVKNPGSYNSQLGVPLSVWQMQSHHTLGIFEAGISRPGEMKNLQAVIQPTLGILTNIGTAHDENFGSQAEKISEKLQLFTAVDTLIYCRDHQAVHDAVSAAALPTLTWGYTATADIIIRREGDHYHVRYGEKSILLTLPFRDQASIENALHCMTVMLMLGYDPTVISQRLALLQAVAMRLELKEGIQQCQVIDDTYNNDLGGLRISLDFLANQKQKHRKSVILSDVLQSGLSETELCTRIAAMINPLGLTHFIGIGETLCRHAHLFTGNAAFYADTDEFLEQADRTVFNQEIILVKGARVFQFERIVNQLLKRVHGTVMEVDMGALIFNLNYFRARLQPTTRLMVMVKAFAYGSGSVEIANLLQYHHVDYLGVAYADEGVELRRNNITVPIMVMNPAEDGFAAMSSYHLEPELYSFKILEAYLSFLNGKRATIHIKLNTGMNRLGFDEQDIPRLIGILKANPTITVATIFSHLAGSDEAAHDAYSNEQGQKFKRMADAIIQALGYRPMLHILNTGGILRLPEWQLDMVRLGIGLYGVDPTTTQGELRPVATLKTVVSQVRRIHIGDTIGYGRKGVASQEMSVATIAIGYADGYSRAFSRGIGHVWIKGQVAPVIGNVCMDMTMIDVTGMDVQEGDDVIIFGKQYPIYEVARQINTIPYEILTNTSERVRRVFVAESI